MLVFTKTEGFRHGSIEDAVAAIETLGQTRGWRVSATEDAAVFTLDELAAHDVVVFALTTGDVLDDAQQSAFEEYMAGGGAWAGIHSATDTEYGWPFYGMLVGGYFDGHPAVQEATIDVLDSSHPSTAHLDTSWVRRDEWYNFEPDPSGSVDVLLALDESTYEGGTMGRSHPIAWSHTVAGGRAWYTGGGHTSQSYEEPEFLEHLAGGIEWAAAKDPTDGTGGSGEEEGASTSDQGTTSTGPAPAPSSSGPSDPDSSGETGEAASPDATMTSEPTGSSDSGSNAGGTSSGCRVGTPSSPLRILCILIVLGWHARRRMTRAD